MTIVSPKWLSLPDWADQVSNDTGVGRLADTSKWQAWAAQLSLILNSVPSPYDFDDWKDWAELLTQIL
jgi:hypothetical protein